jgi:hypothetical protein
MGIANRQPLNVRLLLIALSSGTRGQKRLVFHHQQVSVGTSNSQISFAVVAPVSLVSAATVGAFS